MMKVKFVLIGVILFVVSLFCAAPSFAEPVERVERAVVNTTSGVHVSVRKTLSRKESRALRRMLDEAESVVKMARAAADRASRIPDLEKRIREMEKTCGQLSTVRDELREIERVARKNDGVSRSTRELLWDLAGTVVGEVRKLNAQIRGLYKKLHSQRIRLELTTSMSLDVGSETELMQISSAGLALVLPMGSSGKWLGRIGFTVGANTLEKNLAWSVSTSFERSWGMFGVGPVALLNVDAGNLQGMQAYNTGVGLNFRITSGSFSAYLAPYAGVSGYKAKKHGKKPVVSVGYGLVLGTAWQLF